MRKAHKDPRFELVITPEEGVRASRLLAALEAVWDAIRKHHPEVPAAVISIGGEAGGGRRRKVVAVGHWSPDRWHTGAGRRAEVMLAGELFADLENVLEVLLHEAAHGLAGARGIEDTSRDGRYHNDRYRKVAEEIGLETYKRPTYGWDTRLNDAMRERYAAELELLRDAHAETLHARRVRPGMASDADEAGEGGEDGEGGEGGDAEPQRGGRKRKLVCRCEKPRIIYTAKSTAEEGGILCAVCGEPFAEEAQAEAQGSETQVAAPRVAAALREVAHG